MHVTLEPIGTRNRDACIALDVAPEQRPLIATNERSLSQASANAACVPMAVCLDGEVVGFLMYEPRGNDVVSLHRFMIDRRHQRRGIGLRAMHVLISNCTASDSRRSISVFGPKTPGPASCTTRWASSSTRSNPTARWSTVWARHAILLHKHDAP